MFIQIQFNFWLIDTCSIVAVIFDMPAGFLQVIYSLPNFSMVLERNETRLERNKMCLARNEARGGNFLLNNTVCGK